MQQLLVQKWSPSPIISHHKLQLRLRMIPTASPYLCIPVGTSPIDAWILSSLSSHCANTRLRPCSASMRNVADAFHTHCLQPMHENSSTKTARFSAGSSCLAICWGHTRVNRGKTGWAGCQASAALKGTRHVASRQPGPNEPSDDGRIVRTAN